MRRLRKESPKPGAREIRAEPLAEGLVPLLKNGQRNWGALSDEELVSLVKKFMKELGISGKKELHDVDQGLYLILHLRERKSPGIIEKVGFEAKRREWESLSDEEFAAHVQQYMKGRGITAKGELAEADAGLYSALLNREKKSPGIKEKVGFEVKRRDLESLGDEELAAHAKLSMVFEGIISKSELKKLDDALYKVLARRGLLGRLFSDAKIQKQYALASQLTEAVDVYTGGAKR
jgi:hypothetical protein